MKIQKYIVIILILSIEPGFCQPLYLSDFQYFSDSEISGGGPFTGTSVSFGAGDVLEGFIHTNGNLILSNFGCPQFYGYVRAVNGITSGNCNPDSVFRGGYDAEADSFYLPTPEVVNELKNYANYVFIADSMINRSDIQDTLIMTKIEFQSGGFMVNQWSYLIPPIADDSSEFNDFGYYHNHANNSVEKCEIDGFHNFDFPPPESHEDFIIYNHLYMTSSAIIHVQGGQVLVSGIVEGQFVLITDDRTEYQRPDNSGIFDYCYDNIWLTDDLTYIDSDSTGRVALGSPNRLGLISGANVIIANTLENGGGNSHSASDININAAIITLEGSFTAHYWQNTTQGYSTPILDGPSLSVGDGRGETRMGITTGTSDIRGRVNLWGALVQKKRGFMRRNSPGPYSVTPGIGYNKNYHYDPNLLVSPPPGFEELINPLNLFKYGDVNLNGDVDIMDVSLVLEWMVHLTTLENIQILNANVSQDYSVSALDASIIYQYVAGTLDTLPIDGSNHFGSVAATVSMEDYEIQEGEQVLIPIYLTSAEGIFALSGEISYDPAYLEYVDIEWSDAFDHTAAHLSTVSGKINIASATSAELDGDVTIATLRFNALPTLPGNQTSAIISNLRWNEEIELHDVAMSTLQNVTSINSNKVFPSEYSLSQNYPNPFNPTTALLYGLPEDAEVSLIICDIRGKAVKIFISESQKAGWHERTWNGLNDNGELVSTGIYLARLQAGSYSKTIKMLYLK
jgi:hypothetical protein